MAYNTFDQAGSTLQGDPASYAWREVKAASRVGNGVLC
jgi:hypothetical protein